MSFSGDRGRASVMVVLVLLGVCGEQLCELFTSFLYTVTSIATVTVFSYLIAVSSRLFLSQPVIFMPPVLQPPTLWKSREQ